MGPNQKYFEVNSRTRIYQENDGQWVLQLATYQGGHKKGQKPFKVWGSRAEVRLTKDYLLKMLKIMEGTE